MMRGVSTLSRGRGGRGRGAGHGGAAHAHARGRGGGHVDTRNHLTSHNRPPRPVSSFPVISRNGEPVTKNTTTTTNNNATGHSSLSAVSQRVVHNDSNDDDDDYAPPAAQSARRHEHKDEANAHALADAPHIRKPRAQLPHRPHLHTPPTPSASASAPSSSSSSSAMRPPAPSASRNTTVASRVQTVLTENDTELPRKLNTKVFIDGLPYTYEPEPGKPSLEEELLEFATAWKVGKALRLIKKNGHGFGFLVLRSPHSVDTAVRVLNGRKFLGRALRVAVPKPRDLENVNDVAGMKDMGKLSHHRQVLLSDLAKIAEPEIIREVLRDVAPQLEKKLETIKMTSRNRKAFLTFAAAEDVTAAVRFLDGFHLLGRKITATPAAAPGSLPYSHHHRLSSSISPLAQEGPHKEGTNTHTTYTDTQDYDNNNDDEDAAVVPLGAPIAMRLNTTPARVDTNASSRPVVTSAATLPRATGGRSNVTGQTEKYNLLDDGPADVYVGNLSEGTTEAQLRQHFAPCGRVTRCELVIHRETHLPTGIAHITFALPAYAAYAQQHFHGSRLRGAVLRVDRGDRASPALAGEAWAITGSVHSEEHEFGETQKEKKNGASKERTAETTTRAMRKTRGGVERDALLPRKRARGGEQLDGRATRATAAAAEEEDDDEDDEEHFHDVDVVTQSKGSGNGSMRAKKAKKGHGVKKQRK